MVDKNKLEVTGEELLAEANEAFYAWEEKYGAPDMSDDDRVIWCIGYCMGRGVTTGLKARAQ